MSSANRRKFRLKPFASNKPGRYRGLNAVVYTGPDHNDDFDIIERAIGDEIHYGTLMAYLFRRFGYPNAGWDDYKELACYRLSTPEPDMFMRVVPYVGNASNISISFMVGEAGHQEIEDYNKQLKTEHLARMHDWIESTHGLPDWADAWLAAVRRDWAPSIENWRQAFGFFQMYSRRAERAENDPSTTEIGVPTAWLQWAAEKREAYLAIEPSPGPRYRSATVEDWLEDDPLKRYVLAANAALADLKTPVRVRDAAINAFGCDEDSRTILKEPSVAGFPCGAIGNLAPQEFARLHQLIYKMGKGNPKRGLKKVLKALGDDTAASN